MLEIFLLVIFLWKPIYWLTYKSFWLNETSYLQDTKDWFKSLWKLIEPMEVISEWRAQISRNNQQKS